MKKRDIVKDIIFFFVTLAVTFGYVLLLLLILSFISLSFFHFEIEKMLIGAGACMVLVGILYIVKMVKKYRALIDGKTER